MDLLGLFSSWGNRSGAADKKDDTNSMVTTNPPVLDNFPDLVLLNLFDHLDRATLNKLRQISAISRDVIENIYGLHVIVPPRDYSLVPPSTRAPASAAAAAATATTSAPIHTSVIQHILKQMEGKVVHTLEMADIPAPYAPFDLDKAIQFPGKLRHVKLNYCGARLIHDVLVKCTNLVSFQYTSNIWRALPKSMPLFNLTPGIPIIVSGSNFLGEISSFPNSSIKLANLKRIYLSINRMTQNKYSDWGNVIFLMLVMPVLPSLTFFEFGFKPNMLISWRTHMGILSCLGEFLGKTPNLQVFRYNSNFADNAGTGMNPDWRIVLFGLIEKYGSNMLKAFGQAASRAQVAVFENVLQNVRNLWDAAGTSLRDLQELDVKLGNSTEHALFMHLVSHLPACLKKIQINDLSEEDVDPDDEVANIYSYFAVPLERDRRLAVYDSVRSVQVNLKSTRIRPTSLTNILRHLPQLKELELRQSSTGITQLGVMANEVNLEEYENSAVFQKLEKLSLINVCIWCQQAQPPILAKFKGLRELNIVIHENVLKRWVVMPGIQTNDMIRILANLPKLDKVHAKPLLGPPAANILFSGQGDNADPMVIRDQRNRRTLEKLGTLVGLELGEVAQNVRRPSAYEFTFDTEI